MTLSDRASDEVDRLTGENCGAIMTVTPDRHGVATMPKSESSACRYV